MSSVDYEMMEPFDIDNGELDGLTPQHIFCLGYEWRQVQDLLDAGDAFARPLHSPNAERVKRMCIRRQRRCRVNPSGDGWCLLEVAGVDGAWMSVDAPA